MDYTDYINKLAIEQAQQQNQLKENQTKNVIDGFSKGGILGAAAAIAKGEEDNRKALLQNTMALNQPMIGMSNQNMQETMNNAAQNNGNTFVGTPTGYAAPIQFTGNAQPNQTNDNAINNYYNENLPALSYEGSATEELNNKGKLTGFASGVNDLVNGFNENYNTGYNPQNLQRDANKGVMNKIGEAIGTTARVAQNPAVQGVVSGLITGALTGNPLAGYAAFSDLARKRANSNAYKDVLSNLGIQANPGMFGMLDKNDMQSIGNLYENKNYHDRYLDYRNDVLLQNQEKMQEQFDKYKRDYEEKVRHNKEVEANNARKTNIQADKQKNGTTITHVSTGGGTTTKKTGGKTQKTTAPSGQYVIMQAPNGKKYNVPVERIKEYKSYGGKIVG